MKVRILESRHLVGYGKFEKGQIVDLPTDVASMITGQRWADIVGGYETKKKNSSDLTPMDDQKSGSYGNFESLENEEEDK